MLEACLGGQTQASSEIIVELRESSICTCMALYVNKLPKLALFAPKSHEEQPKLISTSHRLHAAGLSMGEFSSKVGAVASSRHIPRPMCKKCTWGIQAACSTSLTHMHEERVAATRDFPIHCSSALTITTGTAPGSNIVCLKSNHSVSLHRMTPLRQQSALLWTPVCGAPATSQTLRVGHSLRRAPPARGPSQGVRQGPACPPPPHSLARRDLEVEGRHDRGQRPPRRRGRQLAQRCRQPGQAATATERQHVARCVRLCRARLSRVARSGAWGAWGPVLLCNSKAAAMQRLD
jgi:hypothetical protein